MSIVERILEERKVPDVLTSLSGERIASARQFEKRREELKRILSEEEYGYIPAPPDSLKVDTLSVDERFCAGKAPFRKLLFTVKIGAGEFSFPVCAVIPRSSTPVPAFVHINFRPDTPDKYMPSEEICDRGFATFSFCYNDVTIDSHEDDEMRDGIAKYFTPEVRRPSSPGKIAMWAWAAMRVMDYIETLDVIDKNNVAVVGHSRLGKTALLAGAFDERFNYIISNCSGCAGAAITRGKVGEQPTDIVRFAGRWFCPRYLENAERFDSRGYDQNFLLALSVPRHIMIGSAIEDEWADPESEFLSLASVNEVYKLYGKRGLVHRDEIPKPKSELDEGEAFYQVRYGIHYFSREDWISYMNYIDKAMKR